VFDWPHLSQWLAPHAAAVALCGSRLLPVCFLCPLFGGQSAPMTVRLGLALALSLSLHLAGGVQAPAEATQLWFFGGTALKEVLFGTTLGLVASLPFDAARIGGRFVDLFRGTSAEAALPTVGTRESAFGNGLYQMLVALVATSGALPLVIAAIWHSFGVVRLGAFVPTQGAALQVVGLATGAVATGLAIGAPMAGVSLAVDFTLGLASRAAPQMRLQEVGAPLKILGGGALLWLGVGLICERLLASVLAVDGVLHAVLEATR
jgi:type III secretion protein T